jgi:hypothetical protein
MKTKIVTITILMVFSLLITNISFAQTTTSTSTQNRGEKRSVVAKFVQYFVKNPDRNKEDKLGPQVREIAKSQNASSTKFASSTKKDFIKASSTKSSTTIENGPKKENRGFFKWLRFFRNNN